MPKYNTHLNDILHAIRQNNIDSIKRLMSTKVKTKDKSAFSFACLVDSHQPNDREDLERLVLEATLLDDPTILSYFIKHGATVNFCCKFILGGTRDQKCTPLHIAVEKRSHDIMEVLINANGNTSLGDSRGKTPLHYACQNCDVIATRLLLLSGANTHLVDKMGTTALQVASRFGHVDLVRVLLDHNAQIFQEKQKGESPLHIAAKEGHIPLLDMFGRLVDIDIQTTTTSNQSNCSSIHLACGRGLIETVRFMVERFGANINILDSEGNTPLHWCVRSKYNFKTMRRREDYSTLVEYLLKKKTLINKQNICHADTALHMAAQNGYHKCAESLLVSGADPLIKNKAGLSAREVIPTYDAEMKQIFLRCAPFSNAYLQLAQVVRNNPLDERYARSQGNGDEDSNLLNKHKETQEVQVYKTVVQTSYHM